jgi:hypothetical protein
MLLDSLNLSGFSQLLVAFMVILGMGNEVKVAK